MRWLILFLIILSLPLVLPLDNETSIASAGDNESFLSFFGNAEASAFIFGQGVNETEEDDEENLEPVTQSASGGDDSSPKPECTSQDTSACSPDEKCLSGKCVKLFDVKILEFESPVALGDFFDFIYLLKGMAEIDNDVQIDFWIENSMGEEVTAGSDVIYMGNYEEKRETAKIFLPAEIDSGVYKFFVKVTFEDYSASSFRTIEIIVKPGEGIAEIKDAESKIPIPLIVIIVLAILFALSKNRNDKIKTQKAHELHHSKLFSPHAKPKGKSVTLHHLVKPLPAEQNIGVEKPENQPVKKKKIAGQIDTKEELDEILDELEKKEKDSKEKPF